MGCHHPQGLLISSPRGCSISVTTWTQLLINLPPPAAILLVTGPFGVLISVFSSLPILEISLRSLSSKSFWLWGGEPSGSPTSLASICLISCNKFLCKILGFCLRVSLWSNLEHRHIWVRDLNYLIQGGIPPILNLGFASKALLSWYNHIAYP